MSRNIGQKKRFEVLQRDGFACKYCGQKPPYVQLEVDHIIPRSEGGTNEINNLITACFNCNRGKGGSVLGTDSKNLYRVKLNDTIYKVKCQFYNEWNKCNLGMIDEKTKVLISMWVKNRFSREDEISIISCISKVEKYILVDRFKLGLEFCDEILLGAKEVIVDEIHFNLELIVDDSGWLCDLPKPDRLNYVLTEDLVGKIEGYALKKYTLFPELI